jgi:uncharacterized membrane protein YfcA
MDATIVLAAITLFAAAVNGGLGYGFSSLTMPVALVFYTNRLLNPAMVLIEVFVNIYVLVMNRQSVASVWKRVRPVVLGLPIGVLLGSFFLSSVQPGWIKLFTYVFLLPMILIQAAGIRRPIHNENGIGLPFGTGIGFLYSITTVSGPPLAVFFNNQGLVKKDFRAALGIIRTAESSFTAVVYAYLGFYSVETFSILKTILPSVLIGIPIGVFVLQKLNAETFRRICMTFDVWVVGFGLSRVLMELAIIKSVLAYGVMGSALVIDGYLLYAYFTRQRLATT